MSTGKGGPEEDESEILLEGEKPAPGTKTPQEIVDEYRGKDNPIAGTHRLSVELINDARRLWGIEGYDKGKISHDLGLGMNLVEVCIKGIPKGKAPGERVDIPRMMVGAGLVPSPRVESPSGSATKIERGTMRRDASQSIAIPVPLVQPDTLSSLYALAVQRGFPSLDEFILTEVIPWYGVKMSWEWRTNTRITPREFERFIDDVSRKSALLEQCVREVYGQ